MPERDIFWRPCRREGSHERDRLAAGEIALTQGIDRAPGGGLADWLRAAWSQQPARRVSTLLVAGLWLYAAGLTGWLARLWLAGHTWDVPAWTLMLPPQFITAIAIWSLLVDARLERARRIGWWFFLASTVVDMLAVVDWSYVISVTGQPFGTWADVLYILNYALIAGGIAAFFISCGGSFARPRTWIDAITLHLGAVAALMPFLFRPLLDPQSPFHASVPATLGYTVGIGVAGTVTLLLFMQVMDWRRNCAMLLILLGVAADLGTDILSVAANVRGHFQLGNLDDLGYCWFYVWIASAALLERRRGPAEDSTVTQEGNVYSFLPVVAILLSIAIVVGVGMWRIDFSLLTPGILLAVGAALLIARQLGVRYEVRRLNAALAIRNADARLTELVRRSADMIAVVAADGVLSYVSPAANSILGQPPDALVGREARALLGAANEGLLWALLNDTRRRPRDPVELEFSFERTGGTRTVLISGSNELSNPLINGLVLTARDITEQRATEREVLEIASRERHRLSGEVHEGIGQDLTGIALMLKSLSTTPDDDSRAVREALGPIVEEVNRTVGSVRALARGLSPLGVVRGSLVSALRMLAAEVEDRQRIPVRLRCEATTIDGTPAAEHLYYIAHEAVSRAVRRRHCTRVDVELRAGSAATILSVSDDALGGSADKEAADELPNRLMGYRARLIGGTLRIVRRADAGSYVELTVPAPAAAAPAAAAPAAAAPNA